MPVTRVCAAKRNTRLKRRVFKQFLGMGR
jgi:hypothetical protein